MSRFRVPGPGARASDCAAARRPASLVLAVCALTLLGGCVALDSLSGRRPQVSEIQTVRLPNNPARLGQHPVEVRVTTVLELTEQKRFDEARALLAEMRATQPEGSESWKAVTAAMAIAALRGGDMLNFHSLAGELDARLADGYRVDYGWVEVVTLHRALKGGRVPVNAPPGLRDYLRDLVRTPATTGGES